MRLFPLPQGIVPPLQTLEQVIAVFMVEHANKKTKAVKSKYFMTSTLKI
jgi:hypothetical protein